MFEALSDRFDGVFKRLRSRGKLTEKDIDEVARELRVALLEADVNVRVARNFIARVKERAAGAEVAKSLSPAQQVIKIVNEELVETLGGTTGKLAVSSKPPTIIMMAGLQGSGKTTASAKLAKLLKSQSRRPLLVGADLQRPAAVEQLRVLGERVGVPVWSEPTDPVQVARSGLEEARRLGRDIVIVDTAGRLQIDADLMTELRDLRDAVKPHDVLLVVDAMTGQEAVNVATEFDETVGLTGVVLTKVDGDARGGAALSVKEVVGKPILYAGTGEKLDDFEAFHPDRMASRILGMGDVLTLIEKAEQAFDEEEMVKTGEKLRKGQLTLEDFLDQMRQVKKMGPLQNVLGMLPGVPRELRDAQVDDGDHLLDDTRRTARPDDHQRVASHADRRGERGDHLRRQRSAQAVQDGAADDEGGRERQDAAAPEGARRHGPQSAPTVTRRSFAPFGPAARLRERTRG
jgi:signal recognition particle subunit SRP54